MEYKKVTPEYHGQINEERLYWKHKFYTVTQGSNVAHQVIQIDLETQRQIQKTFKEAR